MTGRSPLAAAVLAGGHSRRMGTDKAALRLRDGRTLLERQVELLHRSGADEILVSARAGQKLPAVSGPYERVDDLGAFGPLGAIVTLLRHTRCARVLVIAVDLPALDLPTLQLLCGAPDEPPGVVLSHGGQIEPLISIYPRAWLSAAETALAAGELSLRQLLLRPESVRTFRFIVAPSGAPLLNWNSPGDFDPEHGPN